MQLAPKQSKDVLDSDKRRSTKPLQKLRTEFLLDNGFLGTLAMELDHKWDSTQETAYMNGKAIGWNADPFYDSLKHSERTFVEAHEILHYMYGHHLDAEPGWDHRLLNITQDVVINGDLLIERIGTIPPDCINPVSWPGGPAEFWKLHKMGSRAGYKYLEEEYPEPPEGDDEGDDGGGNGQGKSRDDLPDPGSTGECRQQEGTPSDQGEGNDGGFTPMPEDERNKEREKIKQAVAKAHSVSKAMGDESAGMDRFAERVLKAKVKWGDKLKSRVASMSRSTYTWMPPHRHYIQHEIYLPQLRGESIGHGLFVGDTSGSMSWELDAITGELNGLAKSYDGSVTCISCDTKVQHSEKFVFGFKEIKPKWSGGGGTNYRHPFKWYKENVKEKVDWMIFGTDGWCSRFPEERPPFPVFWLVWGRDEFKPPFGEVIYVY